MQDLFKEGGHLARREGLEPAGGRGRFEGFATPAEAQKRSAKELLDWIHKAKELDPPSYANIVSALDTKGPDVTVDVACDTTRGNFGKNVLSASMLRDGTWSGRRAASSSTTARANRSR